MDVPRLEGNRPPHSHKKAPSVKRFFQHLLPSPPLLGPEFLEMFERDVSVFGDNLTMHSTDFKRIVNFINARSKKLYRNRSRYYRREETGLTHSLQVHMPTEDSHTNDMKIFIHLKAPEMATCRRNVHSLNQGSEKLIKLSLLIDIQRRKICFCATATHRYASKKGNFNRSQKKLLKAVEIFQNEISILELFKGREGVLQLLGHATYPAKGYTVAKAPKMNMVFEYAEQDLLEYMNSIYSQSLYNPDLGKQWVSSPDRQKIVMELLTGLVNIHDQNIIHGDVKLDNILLCEEGAKFGDFGFARNAGKQIEKLNGTAIFLSPELLQCVNLLHEINHHPPSSSFRDAAVVKSRELRSLIGKKTDVYSLGICFHFLKYLRQPDYLFVDGRQKENSDILDSGSIGLHIRDLEEWYKQFQPDDVEGKLIKQMMELNPDQRISAKEALVKILEIYLSSN